MPPTPYHALRRAISASAELITLAEAKLYLRVDHAEEDLLISEIIVAVRCYAEQILGRSLVEQGWQVDYLGCLPCEVRLPMRPVQSITALQLSDEKGNGVTVSPAAYRLLSSSLLHVDNGLNSALISIIYTAGDSVIIPHDMRQAMLMHIAMCYDMRGADAPLPAATAQIYDTYRDIRI